MLFGRNIASVTNEAMMSDMVVIGEALHNLGMQLTINRVKRLVVCSRIDYCRGSTRAVKGTAR